MSKNNLQLFLGALLTLFTVGIILYWGFNEEKRMEDYASNQKAQAIEVGAGLFEGQCSRCHGPQGQGILGLCPPLNDRSFFDNRMKEVGWVGSMEDYIVATASSGRLVSTRPQLYPGNPTPPAMPAFADQFGGPLRQDQLRSIAAFILNWEPAAQEILAAAVPTGPTVGTDITKELPAGDATRGEAIANKQNCVACHVTTPVGPAWAASAEQPGIGDRAASRLEQDDYQSQGKATSAEQYLFESVVNTSAYVVPPFASNLMPAIYGTTLTDQDMADIIAYLLTIK